MNYPSDELFILKCYSKLKIYYSKMLNIIASSPTGLANRRTFNDRKTSQETFQH